MDLIAILRAHRPTSHLLKVCLFCSTRHIVSEEMQRVTQHTSLHSECGNVCVLKIVFVNMNQN